jgi:hypothetical protein
MEETTLFGRLPEQNFVMELPAKQLRKKKALEFIVYFFILSFTYAGLRKLIDLEMFVKEVWGFAIFGSKQMVRVEFILLSCFELIVALLLTIPRTRKSGIYGAFILMVTINVCFFIMQQYAKVIPLYYGGVLPNLSFINHLIFNIAVLFLALRGVLIQNSLNQQK